MLVKISIKGLYIKLLFFLLFYAFSTLNSYSANVLQNGDFQDGINNWNIYERAVYPSVATAIEEYPYESGNFMFNLHPDDGGYFGLVVYQPLNLTNVANKTVTLYMKLTNVYGVVNGQTVCAYIAYVTNTNQLIQQKIGAFNNADITDSTFVTTIYTIPSNVRKIVGFGLAKEGYGKFLVDDIVLDINATVGALPVISNADKKFGPYGTTITISGQNFGNTQGLTSLVTIGESEEGITLISWSDTEIVIKVDDPASGGSIVVVNDFVPSNNNNKFEITSPHYNVLVDSTYKTYIKGSKARFVLVTEFNRGYSAPNGISFVLDTSSTHPSITTNIATFYYQGLKTASGAVLEVDTTGLLPGLYPIEVIANDNVLQARYTGVFLLEVVSVGNIKLFYENNEINPNTTYDINTRQGELYFYYEFYDSQGRLINPPSMGEMIEATITSSDDLGFMVYKSNMGFYRFFANENSDCTLTFTTPDGYSKSFNFRIRVDNTPKVLTLNTGDTIYNDPNGSNGQSLSYFAEYASAAGVSYGFEGDLNINFNNTSACWFCEPVNVSGIWKIYGMEEQNYNSYLMPIEIGTYLVYASDYDGTRNASRNKKFSVINTPGYASLKGKLVPVGGFGEIFYIEFYDTYGNFLFPRIAYSIHFSEFVVGFIPPGSYKLKFVFQGLANSYWYPNVKSFEDAQVVNLSANQNFQLPYVFTTQYLTNGEPEVNPIYKDFGTKDLGSNTSQSFTLKNIGNDSLTISGISIVGDSSFSATHNCPGVLAKDEQCTIEVYFNPESSGTKTGYLKIAGANPNVDYIDVPLIGAGKLPIGSGSVIINNGADFTNNRVVTLTITCDDPAGCSQMCISNDTDTCTTFTTFTTTKSWTLSAGDGLKTVYVKLKNRNNQIGTSFYDTILLDTTPPVLGSFYAVPEDSKLNLYWNDFDDATSGIANYTLYGGTTMPSSCSGTALYTGTSLSYEHTNLINGTTYYYRLCILDNAGNVNSITTSAKPLPETDAPVLSMFTINNGQPYTKANTVTLQIEATDASGVAQMCISNTSTCNSWINYATTVNAWTLTTGAGLKTVYIWFRDILGNTSNLPHTATITVDNVASVDATEALQVTPGVEENSLTLTWFPAIDAHSYVKAYRIISSLSSTGTACTGTPLAEIDVTTSSNVFYNYTHTALLAGKTYYYRVCAVDAAGNMSPGKTGSGRAIDTRPPVNPYVIISDDNIYTKTTTVTLRLGAEDVGGVTKMCIGNTPTSCSWVAYTPTKTWRLSSGSGERTVYVKFMDGAGNISDMVSDSIWLDTVKPVDGKLTGISGDQFVLLSWTDAVENGGSGLQKYVVKLGTTSYPSCTSGTTIYEGLEKSYMHTGLTNGSSYYYRVCAIDNAGNISTGKTYLGKPSTLTTITGSFPIATTTNKEQAFSVVFNGTYYAVGIKGVNSNPNSIGVQFLTKNGVKVGSPLIITGTSSVEPRLSTDGQNFLIVWSDNITKTIRGQIINFVRTLSGTPFDISQTALEAGCIDTYANPIFDGTNYFVIWNYDEACTQDGSGHDVFGRFVSPSGELVGDIINLIDEIASGRQEYHTMAFDGENILVLWQDARRGITIPDPCDNGGELNSVLTDIYGQFISKSTEGTPGSKIGSNIAIYEGTNPVDFEKFSVTYGGNGNFYAVWQEMSLTCNNGITPEYSNIKMAMIDNLGSSGIVDVTSDLNKLYFAPEISSNGLDLLVTWHDFTVAGNIEIWAQRYDFDLLPINESFLLVSKPGNQLGGVANYSNDKYFIIWNDKVTVNPTTGDFVFGDVYGALISFPVVD